MFACLPQYFTSLGTLQTVTPSAFLVLLTVFVCLRGKNVNYELQIAAVCV